MALAAFGAAKFFSGKNSRVFKNDTEGDTSHAAFTRLTFGSLIPKVPDLDIAAMAEEVEDETQDGEGGYFINGGAINIPSLWDNGVFLFAGA